jgi:hypothetical protein
MIRRPLERGTAEPRPLKPDPFSDYESNDPLIEDATSAPRNLPRFGALGVPVTELLE